MKTDSKYAFSIRKIRTSELNEYIYLTEAALDVLLPLSYLLRGDVYGLFSSSGEMMGGYVLVTRGPLRSFSGIPPIPLLQIESRLNLQNIFEINGLWISKKVSNGFIRSWFRLHVLYKLIISGRSQFVFTVSEDCAKLLNSYSRSKPKIIYRGPTLKLPGMGSTGNEIVALGSTWACLASLILKPELLKNRISLGIFRNRLQISKGRQR